MGVMNKPAEVFLCGLECTEVAIKRRINTSMALNALNTGLEESCDATV